MSAQELSAKIRTVTFAQVWQSTAARAIFAAVFSAVMSKVTLFGSLSPFGVAAAMVFPMRQAIFALLGCILGYSMGFNAYSLAYCIAAAVGFAIRAAIGARRRFSLPCSVSAVLAAAAVGGAKLLVLLARGVTAAGVGTLLGEILLCGGVTYLFGQAVRYLSNPFLTTSVTPKESASLLVTAGLFVAALSGVTVGDYSIGRTLAVVFLLAAALYGGEAAGSIAGILCGVAAALAAPDFWCIPVAYALGGLLAGLFGSVGKVGAVAAMLVASGIAGLYFGMNDALLICLFEIMIASVLFLLIPERVIRAVAAFFLVSPKAHAPARQRTIVNKLQDTKEGLREVSGCIRHVSRRLSRVDREDVTSVFERTADAVCSRCGLKNVCWVEQYNETMDLLQSMLPTLRQNQRLRREDVPALFGERCAKTPEVTAAINRYYAEFSVREAGDEHAEHLREMLADQFDGLAGIFGDLAEEYTQSGYADDAVAGQVARLLENEHLEIEACECQVDAQHRMRLEVSVVTHGSVHLNQARLLARLHDICGRRFAPPTVTPTERGSRLTFTERENFRAEVAGACIAAGNNKFCGDTYRWFDCGDGRAVAIISDGMGSGGRAAIESKMAVSLLSRLIESGFGYDTALSIVNWALMVKSTGESLATVDLLVIDLYTGEAQLLKAGAPSSFLRRGEEVERIAFASMPVGILKNASFERSTMRLQEGDLAVLVSDGAAMGDDDWLEREIALYRGGDLEAFVRDLAARAKAHRPSGQEDDVTVLAVRLAPQERSA